MEIKLSIDEINDVFKMAKQFIDKKNVREMLTQIQLRVKGNVLSAVAFGGIKLGVYQIPYNEKDAQDGAIAIPLLPLFKKDDIFCHITQTDKETIFKTAKGSQSYRRIDGDPVADYEKFLPKEENKADTFYFDPKNLASALSAFSNSEAVKIDYYGNMRGLVISHGNKMALVLPVSPKSYKG